MLPYKNPNNIDDIPPATKIGPKATFFFFNNMPIKAITAPCPTSPNMNPNIRKAVIATNAVGSSSV